MKHIVTQLKSSLRLGSIPACSPAIKQIFATSPEITLEGHFNLLLACQKHIDESCSKTFNLDAAVSASDVTKLYLQAHNCGLKGLTIFRNNCLDERTRA